MVPTTYVLLLNNGFLFFIFRRLKENGTKLGSQHAPQIAISKYPKNMVFACQIFELSWAFFSAIVVVTFLFMICHTWKLKDSYVKYCVRGKLIPYS